MIERWVRCLILFDGQAKGIASNIILQIALVSSPENKSQRILYGMTNSSIVITLLVFFSFFVAEILEAKIDLLTYHRVALGMRCILSFSLLVAFAQVVIGWIAIIGGKVRFRNRDIWMWILAHLYFLFLGVSLLVSRALWSGVLA